MLFMKKNLIKGMVALCVCALFASCSKDPGFETPNQFEITKNEYKANFIKKYGEIDPNQTWDFTDLTKSPTRTSAQVDRLYLIKGYMSSVNHDRALKNYEFDINKPGGMDGIKTWNPNVAVDMYLAFVHSNEGDVFDYYHLEICHGSDRKEVNAPVNAKHGSWYDGGTNGGLNQNSGRGVNTKNLDGCYWVAYVSYPTGYEENDAANARIQSNLAAYTVQQYKEILINGRTYWCFDCNKDGNFSDLIFMVDNADPKPFWKRYMIEDLGGSNDFDFNDIVVDVKMDQSNNTFATIRAMGGTLDFTLKIGDTVWSKEAKGFEVGRMYNTDPTPVWDLVLAEFPVTGWIPGQNNISVTVKEKNSDGVLTEVDIPFPKKGDVPMIIAVYPLLGDWMEERVSIPSDYFYIEE